MHVLSHIQQGPKGDTGLKGQAGQNGEPVSADQQGMII